MKYNQMNNKNSSMVMGTGILENSLNSKKNLVIKGLFIHANTKLFMLVALTTMFIKEKELYKIFLHLKH